MGGFALGGGQVRAGIRGVLLDKTKDGRVFKRGVMHDHQPSGGPASGRWAEVVALHNLVGIPMSAQESGIRNIVALFKETHFRDITPAELMAIVSKPMVESKLLVDEPIGIFTDKPVALEHLNWFLSLGGGAPMKENGILKGMLLSDSGVIRTIHADMEGRTKKDDVIEGVLKIEQQNYSSEDFQFAFGAIDHLSYFADFADGRLHAWFLDRYEWHPLFPGMYPAADGQDHSDDHEPRPTNILHAACVELKAGTARDFWMIGEAQVPLDPFLNPPSANSLANPDTTGGSIP